MKTAAIYCRVSTEDQEREGTSLDSQREACLKKAVDLGYEVPDCFVVTETYSGLSLDRPKLDQLRQWVRERQISAVLAYTLDRLSRDPVHCIILQDELERNTVELILVTETIDTSDMGKLITHIKGFAAKLEAEKIRERTQRGIRQRIKAGKFPSGRRARLYGYNYIPGKGLGEGIRCENEEESKWVRQIFNWFVEDGLGIDRIAYKLRELEVPTPSGRGLWYASEVWKILRNRAYVGETYVFTQTYGLPKYRLKRGSKTRKTGLIMRPKEEWIEIPNATPQIIDKGLFEAAQAQLKRNRERASRNRKQQYLLSGHIECRRCNRNYWGYAKRVKWGGKLHLKRYYRCAGKLQMVSPVRCDNHNLNAEKVESLVWAEVEKLLTKPGLVLYELERRKAEREQDHLLEQELSDVRKSLIDLNKEQQQLLQWALKGFPEETVVQENVRIAKQRADLERRESELSARLDLLEREEIDMARVEEFCELAVENLSSFSYEDKRLALEALHISVQVDGDAIHVTGAIPVDKGCINSTLPA